MESKGETNMEMKEEGKSTATTENANKEVTMEKNAREEETKATVTRVVRYGESRGWVVTVKELQKDVATETKNEEKGGEGEPVTVKELWKGVEGGVPEGIKESVTERTGQVVEKGEKTKKEMAREGLTEESETIVNAGTKGESTEASYTAVDHDS